MGEIIFEIVEMMGKGIVVIMSNKKIYRFPEETQGGGGHGGPSSGADESPCACDTGSPRKKLRRCCSYLQPGSV